jgi:hypothetical protein
VRNWWNWVFDCACGLWVGTIDTACGCGYNSATITPGQFAIKFRGRLMTARCICFFAILMSMSDEAQSLTVPLANHVFGNRNYLVQTIWDRVVSSCVLSH